MTKPTPEQIASFTRLLATDAVARAAVRRTIDRLVVLAPQIAEFADRTRAEVDARIAAHPDLAELDDVLDDIAREAAS
jgi:hypothetical protein